MTRTASNDLRRLQERVRRDRDGALDAIDRSNAAILRLVGSRKLRNDARRAAHRQHQPAKGQAAVVVGGLIALALVLGGLFVSNDATVSLSLISGGGAGLIALAGVRARRDHSPRREAVAGHSHSRPSAVEQSGWRVVDPSPAELRKWEGMILDLSESTDEPSLPYPPSVQNSTRSNFEHLWAALGHEDRLTFLANVVGTESRLGTHRELIVELVRDDFFDSRTDGEIALVIRAAGSVNDLPMRTR